MKCPTQAIRWEANRNMASRDNMSMKAAKLTLRLYDSTIFSKMDIT